MRKRLGIYSERKLPYQLLIRIRKCSESNEKVKLIYDALGYKYAPFFRKKSVVNKTELLKTETVDLLNFANG